MPRIRQYAAKYANEDFQAEVRQRQGFYNVMTITALAEHIGIPRSTLGVKLKAPEKWTVDDLRKLIAGLKLNPAVVLRLLGYSSKEIKKSLEEESV